MKHLSFAALLCCQLMAVAYAQSKLGDAACIYVTSSNTDSSAAVYEKLGFAKKASCNYPAPWVQLSDSSLLIMIRKDNTPYCGLTYYSNHIEKVVALLEKDSVEFFQKPKKGDVIQRYFIKAPGGFNIVIANNPGGFTAPGGITLLNMKQADYQDAGKYPNRQCGVFGEFAHPVPDLQAALAFWKKLGFTVKAEMKAPYPHAILTDGLMIIGLHQTSNFNYPAVTYFGINTRQRIDALKQSGLQGFSSFAGANNAVLRTWEGQHFFIFSLY